ILLRLLAPRPPISTLFPYTTLFRSVLIGSSLIQHAFKFLVGRSRPSGSSLGFPSGNTTAAATFAIVLVYIASREQLSRAQRVIQIGRAHVLTPVTWPSRMPTPA